MNHIKFIQPVYPGDELHTVAKVIDKRAVKKDTGLLTVSLSTYNDQAEKVFTGDLSTLMKR